ncbi:MAG: hypothetical protein II627_05885, partial [Lachnospiraceae bacterium]|nr:hypothetical protein [Lachnospiraceae bacterium]
MDPKSTTSSSNNNYDDIIDLPYPHPSRHAPMPLNKRAAQFAPFSALSGYEDVIEETARWTDDKVELDQSSVNILNEKMMVLQSLMGQRPEITLIYFQPDARKDGGAYVSVTGIVKKIDYISRTLILEDGSRVPMEEVRELEG